MLEYLGSWIDVSKTSATTKEFRFGSVRVARIMLTKTNVGTKAEGKMWQGRVYLPGVGSDDVVWGWTQADVKREIEAVLSDWIFHSGFQELFDAQGASIEATFVMPDEIVVVEGLAPPPASARIIPLEEHRRNGGRGALPPRRDSVMPARRDVYTDADSDPRKPSRSKHRSLKRGQ